MAGYTLRDKFSLGYRNKEDISNLPPEVLVVGSQNVVTNAAEQVGIRQGYTLDGDAGDQNDYGIDSNYDFRNQSGTKNLRKWGAKLQVRYEHPTTAAVSWITLISSLVATNKARFTKYWNSTELKLLCLFCNGAQTVYEWSGAIGSFLSASNASGIIGGITANPNVSANDSGGIGYVIGDVLTIVAGNSDARLTVGAVTPGGIGSISIQNDGASAYSANDIIKITGAGAQAAFVKVATVSGGGAVTSVTLLTAGTGYAVQSAVATTNLTNGTATGLTLNILTIGNTITQWTLTVPGTGYSAANNIATSGGTGSGATVQIVSVANYSITLSGTQTLSQLGFYDTASNANKFKILINGTVYTYTATNSNGGFTFIGIDTDPTLAGFAIGDAVIQPVVTGASAGANSTSFLPAGFNIDLISTLANQVWYGDSNSNNVYASKVNDYTSVAYASPRLPTDGLLVTIDSPPIAFKPQSNQSAASPSIMYIAAGNDEWFGVAFTLSADLVNQSVNIQRLKTTPLQGAQSQELVADFKNTIAFISNEPILNEFGISPSFFAEPQMVNISDPIKYDMDAYDYADGQVFYWGYYLFFTVPQMGIVRMYNVTKKYWEAPQTIPITRFYTVDGQLYGHSSLTNESYKLFTGYNDNGNPINAVASFPYVATVPKAGEPDDLKAFDRNYTEGYIAGNTDLLLTINYDFGGFSGTYSVVISGQAPSPTIFNRVTDGSLGQNTLGSQPIGSILNLGSQPANPKFRVINTMPKHDFYESQIVYSSNDVDQQWTLLRFGPLVQPSVNSPSGITI